MIIQTTDPSNRTEWAAELTWPDGHVEFRKPTGSRRDAGLCVAINNDNKDKDWVPEVAARLVSRTVTATPWTASPDSTS